MPVCIAEQPVAPGLISAELFAKLAALIYDISGIVIRDGKQAMLSSRINKRIRALKLGGFQEYVQYLQEDATGDEITHMLDAVSTNVTSFFRESHHFDLLAKLVHGARERGARQLRFWSAASSSGQEPYSMAMTIDRILAGASVDWKILATDISTRMLNRCDRGRYTVNELKSVDLRMLDRYFKPTEDRDMRQVTPALRRHLTIARLNLSVPPFPMKGPLDAVFCRNVMIYFDQPVRERLVAEVRRLLRPGGLFCLGHAENLSATGISGFVRIGASAYRRTT